MAQKVAIVGAGAIGTLLGFRAAQGGARVSVLARGQTLANLQRFDMRLRDPGGLVRSQPVQASNVAAELGEQDVVLIALKAPAMIDLAPKIAPLIGRKTQIVTATNGIPWWFFQGMGESLSGLRLSSIDPGGMLLRRFPTSQVVGCVVHLAAFCPEPGMTQVRMGNELIIGPADPLGKTRIAEVAGILQKSGHLEVQISERIQRDIWFKLWGNMTINPISALTGATADRILDDDLVRDFASRCMAEAALIGDRIGVPIDADPDERHAVTRKLGAFRTSMLQDVDAKRPIELEALLGAVRDIAQQVGVQTPFIDALYGLARLHAQGLGLYPQTAVRIA